MQLGKLQVSWWNSDWWSVWGLEGFHQIHIDHLLQIAAGERLRWEAAASFQSINLMDDMEGETPKCPENPIEGHRELWNAMNPAQQNRRSIKWSEKPIDIRKVRWKMMKMVGIWQGMAPWNVEPFKAARPSSRWWKQWCTPLPAGRMGSGGRKSLGEKSAHRSVGGWLLYPTGGGYWRLKLLASLSTLGYANKHDIHDHYRAHVCLSTSSTVGTDWTIPAFHDGLHSCTCWSLPRPKSPKMSQ